jgi:putative dimethyl sulfoxide reductase chaperone
MFFMKSGSLLSDNQRQALGGGIQTACRLFWGPDDSHCREMKQNGLFNELAAMAPILHIHPADTLDNLNEMILRHEDSRALFDALETAYVSLFISNRKGHIIPLYQSCHEYENAPMMGASAVMMKNRLAAVNLSLGSHINEPPDHIAIELEYLFFLLTNGWRDGNVSFIQEASSFAAHTMLPWVLKLQSRLSDQPDAPFYEAVVAATIGILQSAGNFR